MHDIDLKKISKLLSEKTGESVELTSIEKAGSGFHSDGFKISSKDGKTFFLKRVKSLEGGFEFPERRISSLLVSDSMARRANQSPRPIGVILMKDEHAQIAHDISDDHTIYHVQEFETASSSYLDMLDGRHKKKSLDEEDAHELAAVIEFISGVHAIRHPSADEKIKKAVYNDGIRAVIVHPELTFTLLHDFPHDYPHLPLKDQERIIGLMWANTHDWKDRADRLTALHGDFWGANIFFKHDGSLFAIDYSRIPWGDPGIDVGWWLSQYLWRYHKTGNPYFKELGEEFLRRYIAKTGDTEIRKAVTLSIGFLGIVNIYPKFHPDGIEKALGDNFLGAIYQTLENKEFVWEKAK